MKLLKWSKDGGPESPVDAFFIVESALMFEKSNSALAGKAIPSE